MSPPQGPEVSAEPLLEAESQMRPFMKESVLGSQSVRPGMLSANRPEPITPRWLLELTIMSGEVDQNHNNGQGWTTQNQPAQRGAGENNQNQNNHENAPQQNWPQTQYHQQVMVDHPCVTNAEAGGI